MASLITKKEQVEEIRKCRNDPAYFIDSHCKLIDPVKGLLPFRLFRFQKFCIANMLASKFNIFRKPRQMGLSNLTAGFSLWLANFYDYKNIVIISIKEDTAKRFLEKIKVMYKSMPEYMQVPVVNGKSNDYGTTSLMEFANGSRINSIPTSKEAGRSEAMSLLLIDEAAFVEHIEDIWAAAYSALSTGGMCILLSTTNGIGNFYHKTWTEALAGRNNFNPVDLHYKMYPGRDEEWAARQLKDLGKLKFAQEVLCDFLTSGRTVFDSVVLKAMEENIEALRFRHMEDPWPLRKYFDDQYQTDLSIYRSNGERGRCPVHLSPTLIKSEDLYIWKLPEPGATYCMGVDVAKDSSDENDYQAFQIVDYDTNELVAEYLGKLTIHQYAYLILYMSLYYNNAYTAVENVGIGHSLIELLLELDFPRESLYTQQKVKRKRYDDHDSIDTEVIGFTTSVSSKPMIITNLQNVYESGEFFQKSRRCLNQHFTFQYLGNNRMGALSGYSDDLVMASAITQECRRACVPTVVVGARI